MTNSAKSIKDGRYCPKKEQHVYLRRVASGGGHIVIKPEVVEEFCPGMDPYQAALETRASEQAVYAAQYGTLVEVSEPENVNGVWMLHKNLTSLGQEVLDHLEGGVFWSIKRQAPDWDHTNSFYREMIKQGRFHVSHLDLLLASKTDELKALRAELVLFRLTGERDGDYIMGGGPDLSHG